MAISPGQTVKSDWIVTDPEIDFGALFAEFDTLLMGRVTFEAMARHGGAAMPGMKVVVFSRTLAASDYPALELFHG